MHFRYIERLEYILVSLSGVRSWVTAILVVPLMNYGKPCKYLTLASHVLYQFYRYAHYDDDSSFNDFSPFGGWKRPTMKQYSANKRICGAGVDLNYY